MAAGAATPSGPVVVSWSGGKDAAWALHVLRAELGAHVVGLLTTVHAGARRVAVHEVPTSLLRAQARAVGLPLHVVDVPRRCPNAEYERRMRDAFARLQAAGVRHVAFGDLFLADVRAYRERLLEGTGMTPLFPLWGRDTAALARAMHAAGVQATVAVVDARALPPSLAGRAWDARLVAGLPPGVDPCGERGELHTFVTDAPGFGAPVPVAVGAVAERDGFARAALRATASGPASPPGAAGRAAHARPRPSSSPGGS